MICSPQSHRTKLCQLRHHGVDSPEVVETVRFEPSWLLQVADISQAPHAARQAAWAVTAYSAGAAQRKVADMF